MNKSLKAYNTKTEEVDNAKSELLNNMEDKYQELKRQGKSENEAIGIVISEFGNIDELMKELNIAPGASVEEDTISVTRENAEEYIQAKKRNGIMLGAGVFIIMFGVVLLILIGNMIPSMNSNALDVANMNTFNNVADILILLPLFTCIAVGVAIFIVSDTKISKYKFIQEKKVSLSASTQNFVTKCKDRYQSTYTIMIIVGVILCILAPFCLITIITLFGDGDRSGSVAAGLLLTMIAIAVFLFIKAGEEMDAYKALLQQEDYTPRRKENSKVIGLIGSIYWPSCTAVYLIWSFLSGAWGISWIIWPIAGILFAVISAVYNGITEAVERNK